MGLFKDEFRGVLRSISPIAAIVLALQVFILRPDTTDILLTVLCSVFIVIGFTIFLIGVKVGVLPTGDSIGAEIPRRGSLLFMIAVIFTISFLVILAEPNVTVFTDLVKSIFPNMNTSVMIYAIAAGVGVFLIIAALKTIFGISLKLLLTIAYGTIIVLAVISAMISPKFLGIAFDSGGVITGPLTIPILLALGLGISSAMASRSEMDGFGMIGLASAGPIIAILVMSFFSGDVSMPSAPAVVQEDVSAASLLIDEFVNAAYRTAIALVPLVAFFIFFQKVFLKYSWRSVRVMLIGVTFAGVGAIVFLTGVYAGFMPVAEDIGFELSDTDAVWIILLGLLMGFLVVMAEPAVMILGRQVEDASHGVIKGRLLAIVLAIGVSCVVGLGMAKMVFDIDFAYIIIPGYAIALILMWLSDKDMVGIAFDAGGVATGPMVVTVMMSMYSGLARALYGGDAAIYGFGIVALIAAASIISLSALGVLIKVYKRKSGELV